MGALIWLASYPKSGNTWMRSFLHNLLRNSPTPVNINEIADFCLGESYGEWYVQKYRKPLDQFTLDEIAEKRCRIHEDFTRVFPDSVFVKTHNYLGDWKGYPLHNMDVTAGGIYIVRNPLDVVPSMTHHYGLTIDEAILRLGNAGATTEMTAGHVPEVHSSWSLHVKSWTQNPHPQLFIVRYEDLLEKPRKHFKKVTQFLGLKPPAERLERAIRNSSFKSLKAQEEKSGFREKSRHAQAFFREGRKDQWREQLSDAQIRQIIADHHEQMERFGYIPPDYRDAIPQESANEMPATPANSVA